MKLLNYPKTKDDGYMKRFVLYNGVETKEFYNHAGFDKEIASYPILDRYGKVVEYMDLIGNFTRKPTDFATALYEYMQGRDMDLVQDYQYLVTFNTSLTDFPAKYMINPDVKKLVKAEEVYKFKKACENKVIKGLLNRVRCKRYLNRVINRKQSMANNLIKNGKNTVDIENYFDL